MLPAAELSKFKAAKSRRTFPASPNPPVSRNASRGKLPAFCFSYFLTAILIFISPPSTACPHLEHRM
jgi:hypothetical protein